MVQSKSLRLVAAHQRKHVALMRASRMVLAQVVYSFNNNPTLADVVSPEEAEAVAAIHELRRSRTPFKLRLTRDGDGVDGVVFDTSRFNRSANPYLCKPIRSKNLSYFL